jgi:CRP-like cAMP-binding protein
MTVVHPAEIANELRGYSFFHPFPSETLLVFATMVEPLRLQAGDVLLEQGQNNTKLFFLRSGSVSIQLDGEVVTELSTPGEVIGEMSVISKRPAATTVKALTPVNAFVIDESHMQTLGPKEREKFQNLMFRIYSTVLTERLTKTNDKAKRFEIANRDLIVAHEKLQKMNENLEAEIVRRSQELVQKVRDLTQSHLQPAQAKLAGWSQSGNETIDKNELHMLVESVTEVIDFLKPVAELGQKSTAAQFRRVLLFDTNKKQQTIARLALGGTGVELNMAGSIEELESSLSSQEFDLILCEAEVKEAATKVKTTKPNVPLVLLVPQDMKFYLDAMKDNPSQPFFVSRDVNNRAFTIKNISITVAKILNKDFFGMDKYLSWGARILEKPVRESDERATLIDGLKEHFQSFGIRSSYLDSIHTVTEELLMNAIYDAPTDASGKPLFNHLPRTEKVTLQPEQEARLRYGTDGFLLAVSVTDPFGSLSRDVIVKYLESGYAGQNVESAEKGGAGKGLHMIIENSDLTIFNVKARQKTEVICLFNLERNKEVESTPTFHCFFSA